MHDWPSVFSGNEEASRVLAERLTGSDLQVYVQRSEGPIVSRAGGRSITFNVLVPPHQLESAEHIAQIWRSGQAERSRDLSGRLGRLLLISFLAPLAWWLLSLIPGTPVPALGAVGLGALWAVGFVVLSNAEYRRVQSEKVHHAP